MSEQLLCPICKHPEHWECKYCPCGIRSRKYPAYRPDKVASPGVADVIKLQNDMLKQTCTHTYEWGRPCTRCGHDPWIKSSKINHWAIELNYGPYECPSCGDAYDPKESKRCYGTDAHCGCQGAEPATLEHVVKDSKWVCSYCRGEGQLSPCTCAKSTPIVEQLMPVCNCDVDGSSSDSCYVHTASCPKSTVISKCGCRKWNGGFKLCATHTKPGKCADCGYDGGHHYWLCPNSPPASKDTCEHGNKNPHSIIGANGDVCLGPRCPHGFLRGSDHARECRLKTELTIARSRVKELETSLESERAERKAQTEARAEEFVQDFLFKPEALRLLRKMRLHMDNIFWWTTSERYTAKVVDQFMKDNDK